MVKTKAIALSDIGEVELDLDHLDNLLWLYAEIMNEELMQLRQDKEKSWQENAFLQRYDMADSLLRAILESLAATRANVERLSNTAAAAGLPAELQSLTTEEKRELLRKLQENGIPAAERKAAGSKKGR